MAEPPLGRPALLSGAQTLGLSLGLAAVGVALDQVTKWLARARLAEGRPVAVVGDWFQLLLLRNSGAAFSVGESWTVGFSGLAVAVLVGVVWWAARTVRRTSWAVLVGLGLAGVAGNLVDRLTQPPGVFRGHVTDFLYVRHFATFNVADICLTTAAGLLVLFVLRGVAHGGPPPAADRAAAEG